MLDDPYLKDREQIMARMNRAAPFIHLIESGDAFEVESGSDLAEDRVRNPLLWVDSVASRRLKVAVDDLTGVRDLVANGTHMHAPFALLRAVVESAAVAVWLLEPDDQITRLKRLVGLHISDTENKKSYNALLPDELRDNYDHEPGITSMVKAIGVQRRKCRFPDYTSVVREIDDLPGESHSLFLVWKVCAGVSHGMTWSLNSTTTELSRVEVAEGAYIAHREPAYGLLVSFVGTAVRTIERASVLFKIRCTARPHKITLAASPYP